jgi:uncharacterized membrane protein YdjX (TVP38/TMEM64 family)
MNWRRKTVLAAVLAVTAAAAGVFAWAHRTGYESQLARAVDACRDAGPAVFFTAMALLPALGFPLAAFTFAAGPVFGPAMGVGNVVVCAIAAVTVNVMLSYWIAARGLRPAVAWAVRRCGYVLPEIQPRAAWPVVLLVRVVPGPPFFVQSYLLGLARVPFRIYVSVSTLVPAAYVSATIVFGDALARGDRRAMAGAGMLFLATGVALHLVRRRLARAAAVVSAARPVRE